MAQRSTTQREVRTKQVTYGYARVSTRDQNLARQIDALEAFGGYRTKSVSYLGASAQVDAPFSFV